MKKIFTLIKMELSKIFKRKLTYLLVSLLIGFSCMYPLIVKMELSQEVDVNYNKEEVIYKINNAKNDIVNNDTNENKIRLEFLNTELNLLEFQEEIDIEKNYYKIELYYQYEELTYNLLVDKLLKNNYKMDDIIKVVDSENYVFNYSLSNELIANLADKEKYDEYIKNIKNDKNKLELRLKSAEYFEVYAEDLIKEYQEKIKENNEKIENLKSKKSIMLINELESYNKNYLYNIEILENLKTKVKSNSCNNINDYIDLSNKLIDINNEYYKTLNEKVSKENYNPNDFVDISNNPNMTYEQYEEFINYNLEQLGNKIKIYEYALKNEKAGLIDEMNISKHLLEGGYGAAIILIFSIIIVSIIIPKEFSTGTIRLLLIRPCKRWKILISKIIVSVFLMLIFVTIGFITLYLITGMLFGLDNLNVNELIVKNGSVIEESFVLLQIKNTLLNLVPVIFITILSVLISVISKSQALTIAFGISLYFGDILFNTALMSDPKLWIQYSIIPYLDFSNFTNKYNLDMINLNNAIYGMNITIQNGIIMLSILSVIFTIISIIVFSKKDIKNM